MRGREGREKLRELQIEHLQGSWSSPSTVRLFNSTVRQKKHVKFLTRN